MDKTDFYTIFATGSILHPTNSEKGFVEKKLNEVSDWKAVLDTAINTHLAPILHKTFSELDVEIPDPIQTGLFNAYNQVLLRNIVLQQEFKAFAAVLNEHQIPLVPLKGIYLSEVVYKDVGLRHLSDIDVLIKEEHLKQVCEMMEAEGWSVKWALQHSKIAGEQFNVAHPATLIKNHVIIELHTHLYNGNQGANISKEALWNDTHSEQLLGVEIRQFSNEMLLQHLCLHLHKHLFGRELKILSFCDIREFLKLKGDKFNWQRFRELAEKHDCKEETNQILYLCNSYWSVSIPKEFLTIKIPAAELENHFRSFIAGALKEDVVLKKKMNIRLAKASKLNSNREKIAFILGYAFPSAAFMQQRYNLTENQWLLPWYAYRLIEFSIKTVKTTFAKR